MFSPRTGATMVPMDQTTNVGTVRYMAPEVREVNPDSFDGTSPQSRYSVQADVFSVGMVYYFVFEGGVPPKVPGGNNPQAHFAGLAAGKRPAFKLASPGQREIVELCLRQLPAERPTTLELITLLDGLPCRTVQSCFFSTPIVPGQKKVVAAKDCLAKINGRRHVVQTIAE